MVASQCMCNSLLACNKGPLKFCTHHKSLHEFSSVALPSLHGQEIDNGIEKNDSNK